MTPTPAFYPVLPFKSAAIALLFCTILGPFGLLYASFWGGFAMIIVGIVVICSKLFFPIFLVWVISCVWAVRAVERYNQQLLFYHQESLMKLFTQGNAFAPASTTKVT